MIPSNPLVDYLIDAAQRTVLFWDVMRQRGNQYNEHAAKAVPHVLGFDFELLLSGADQTRPVNYGLVRVIPPEGTEIDPTKRPFIVIDPRAGHGPGIGGFKADSEIGVAFQAGHPCYFIGFTPEPVPGQTIEDVMKAEVAFIEHVAARHADADGKPVVIGNCQAGWALMMLAAYRPELCGPVIVAGAPLSYWAGVHGKNPMRYSGGLLGGTWLTRLTSDLGCGKFDGAWLVGNFEGMNPANTLWAKQYNVYSKVDTETERYLGFEKWWGGHVVMNGEEMQFIVDNLFVGNTLPTGGVETSDGVRLDYRQIQSPIICFCSKGDNITPPQQALGWILDLYDDVGDIRTCGQTIVYAVHDSIGHLGIFVSGRVQRKEGREFASNIDFIDCLPSGLYEAVLTPRSEDMPDGDLGQTDYITRFEPRTLDHIRALGCNDLEDERRFATVQRISEINNGLYQTFAQPFVRAIANPPQADLAHDLHPSRVGYKVFSDMNPWLGWVEQAAETARKNRQPVRTDNPFWIAQEKMSEMIIAALDAQRDVRDQMIETGFLWAFGNPVLQAALGLKADDGPPRPKPATDPARQEMLEEAVADLRSRIGSGGAREACVRAMLYIRMPDGTADERRFEVLRQLQEAESETLEDFKRTVREQFFMLLLDEVKSIDTLTKLLEGDPAATRRALEIIRLIAKTGDQPVGEVANRLARIEKIFGTVTAEGAQKPKLASRKGRSVA